MKKEIIIMGVLSCVFTLVGVGTGMFIQTKITESRVRNIKKYLRRIMDIQHIVLQSHSKR